MRSPVLQIQRTRTAGSGELPKLVGDGDRDGLAAVGCLAESDIAVDSVSSLHSLFVVQAQHNYGANGAARMLTVIGASSERASGTTLLTQSRQLL